MNLRKRKSNSFVSYLKEPTDSPHKSPNRDLITDLRNYRTSLRTSSSNERNGVKRSSISTSSSPNRPPSVLINARRMALSPPKESLSGSSFQDMSVRRLYRGSRDIGLKPESDNILFQLAEIECEDKVTGLNIESVEKEARSFQGYFESMRYLNSLKFELELNFDLARGKNVPYCDSDELGVLYILQDRLEALVSKKSKSTKLASKDDVKNEFQEYTKVIRDILRRIRSKGADNEAVLLEVLWRLIIKIVDKGLCKFGQRTQVLIENHRVAASRLKRKYMEEYENLQILKDKVVADKDKEIAELKAQNAEFKKDISQLKKLLLEKEIKIAEITEIDGRVQAVNDMQNVMRRLTKYIDETETEQQKQAATLNSLSYIMNAVQEFDKKPETASTEFQTDISLEYVDLPELRNPILSLHPFYWAGKTESDPDSMSLLIKIYEEWKGECSFVNKVFEFLMTYHPRKVIARKIRGLVHLFYSIKDTDIGEMFMILSEFYGRIPIQAHQLLGKLKLKMTQHYISLQAAIDITKATLDREAGSLLLSKLRLRTGPNRETSLPELIEEERSRGEQSSQEHISFLLLKLAVTLYKSKKNFKALIEAGDVLKENISNSYSVSKSSLKEILLNKIEVWFTEKDIEVLLNYFGEEENLKISSILERFQQNAYTERSKVSFILREDFFIAILHEYLARYEVIKTTLASMVDIPTSIE